MPGNIHSTTPLSNLRAKVKQLLSFYPRTAQLLICALLAIKLLATLFNAFDYDAARQYDPGAHFPSLASCGFYTTLASYNPPLYHWLSCPVVVATHIAWLPARLKEFHSTKAGSAPASLVTKAKAFAKFEAQTLQRDLFDFVKSGPVAMARTWNFAFLAAFYALACFFLFPAFLDDWEGALFASIVLLALPGYQRLAVMVNPENLLNFGTLAGFTALYFAMKPDVSPRMTWWTSFAVIGALTLSRPLAIVPVAAYAAYIFMEPAIRSRILDWRGLIAHARKYVLLFAAIAVVGSAWWIYRGVILGPNEALQEGVHSYWDKYIPSRKTFDLEKFYTTTYFSDLLRIPDRNIDASDPPCVQNKHTCYGKNDSFLTLLLSETYGEHWLFVSGPPKVDEKIAFKRVSLAFGFVFSPILILLLGFGVWRAIQSPLTSSLLPNIRMERLEWIVAALIGMGGFAAFMLWQATAGLEPGKNSSMKFTYFAFAVPFLLIYVGRGFPKSAWLAKPLIVLAILGYAVLLPIAIF